MDSIDSLISIFRTCFHVCIAFTVLFLIITVVLFFLFDVKTIFNIRTGRAKKKTVKEMQEANNTTGRLRVSGKTLTSQLPKGGKKSKIEKSNESPAVGINPNPSNAFSDGDSQTELLNSPDINEYSFGSQPTSQLSTNELSYDKDDNNGESENAANINFKLVKKIILVHTDEIIN